MVKKKRNTFYMQCSHCGFIDTAPGPEKKPDGKYITDEERPLYCRGCRSMGEKRAYNIFWNQPESEKR